MVKVKILCGGYGLRRDGATKLIPRGQTVDIPEEEAERLLALGYAETVAGEVKAAPVKEPEPVAPDPTESEPAEEPDASAEEGEIDPDSLTVAELKDLCRDAGIDIRGLRSKADLLAAWNDNQMPDLSAEAPV